MAGNEQGESVFDRFYSAGGQNQEATVTINEQELNLLFAEQAATDTSADQITLDGGFKAYPFNFNNEKCFQLFASYTVSKAKGPERLIIEGAARNNQHGSLEETRPLQIIPRTFRPEIEDALGGSVDLPRLIALNIANAFQGDLTVTKLGLEGDHLRVSFVRYPAITP